MQDVSWDTKTVQLIMAGYTLMVKEIAEQTDINISCFLQAGVGGMAAAVIAGFQNFQKYSMFYYS